MFTDPTAVVRLYEQAKNVRKCHEEDWRLASAYCLPRHYSSWETEGPTAPDVITTNPRRKLARVVYDSTGARSLPKYVAVLDRIATPQGQKWHTLRPRDPNLLKDRSLVEYLEALTNVLFAIRDNPFSGFRMAALQSYTSLGAYGNGPTYIGERKKHATRKSVIQYSQFPLRDVFVLTDDMGEIVAVFRRFYLNPRQFKAKFPDATSTPTEAKQTGDEAKDEQSYHEYLHVVWEKDHFDPDAAGSERFTHGSRYLAVKSRVWVTDESGYVECPYVFSRVNTVAGDPYGMGPAVMALSALGGASVQKKSMLKVANRAADPTLLSHDDGAISGPLDLRPGAVNPGAIDRQGRQLVRSLETGNYRPADAMYEYDRQDIEDVFFVIMFRILTEHPEMTATEVIDRAGKEAALVAPTLAAIQTQHHAPMIAREVSLLIETGRMPPNPPSGLDDVDIEVVYTSPMAKALAMEEVSGFFRLSDIAANNANVSGDPSHLDYFKYDRAYPEAAAILSVPTRWMATQDEVSEAREARQDQADQDRLIDNAAGLGSAVKSVSEVGGANE